MKSVGGALVVSSIVSSEDEIEIKEATATTSSTSHTSVTDSHTPQDDCADMNAPVDYGLDQDQDDDDDDLDDTPMTTNTKHRNGATTTHAAQASQEAVPVASSSLQAPPAPVRALAAAPTIEEASAVAPTRTTRNPSSWTSSDDDGSYVESCFDDEHDLEESTDDDDLEEFTDDDDEDDDEDFDDEHDDDDTETGKPRVLQAINRVRNPFPRRRTRPRNSKNDDSQQQQQQQQHEQSPFEQQPEHLPQQQQTISLTSSSRRQGVSNDTSKETLDEDTVTGNGNLGKDDASGEGQGVAGESESGHMGTSSLPIAAATAATDSGVGGVEESGVRSSGISSISNNNNNNNNSNNSQSQPPQQPTPNNSQPQEPQQPHHPPSVIMSHQDIEICQRLDQAYDRALEERQVGYTARYNSVRQSACFAVGFCVVYLTLGTFFFMRQAGWDVADSLLFSIYTITTVGYGNMDYPETPLFQLYTIFFIFIGSKYCDGTCMVLVY
jgi:hypothetical protein